MTNKSHVSITSYDCPICGKEHSDDAVILLDTRMKNSLSPKTKQGLKACDGCILEDYTAIAELISQDAGYVNVGRTGHVKTDALNALDEEMVDFLKDKRFLFIDTETMNTLVGEENEQQSE